MEALLPLLLDRYGNDPWSSYQRAVQFIAGCRAASAAGERLEFH